MVYSNFKGRIKYKTTRTMDRGKFCEVSWESALINGQGSYINPDTSKVLIPGFDCSRNHTPSTTPYKISKLMLSLTI